MCLLGRSRNWNGNVKKKWSDGQKGTHSPFSRMDRHFILLFLLKVQSEQQTKELNMADGFVCLKHE